LEIDTGDDGSVERGVAEVARKAGRIDVLVDNFGQGSWGLVEAFTTEQQKDLFETNFLSAYRMNRAVAPLMRKRGSGLIVQISSLIGRLVLPFMVPWRSSSPRARGSALCAPSWAAP
jgi:NAD(P)-dependent dehydrogenase (short-subunit alcohol dehydrogenase family)